MLILSAVNVAREDRIYRASAEIADGGSRPVEQTRIDGGGPLSSTRLKVFDALFLARQASAAPLANRGALLDRADALLSVAITQRPGFAQATLVQAYLSGVRHGGADPAIGALLKRSYRESPFLKGEGEWRIRYAVAHWLQIDDDLRDRVIEEAVWLSMLSKSGMVHISLIFVGTPAFAEYQRGMMTPLAADVG
jgi:hypothetical protein